MNGALKTQLALLAKLLRYVIRIRPDAIFTTALGIFSSMLEVAGLAVLIPLSTIAAQQPLSPTSPWARFPEIWGFQPSAQFYVVAFFSLLFARTVTQLAATILVHHLNRQLNGIFSIRAFEGFVRHLNFSQMQKGAIGHFVSVAGEEAVRAALIASSAVRLIPLLCLFALYFAMITYQSWQTGLSFILFSLLVLVCLWGAFKKSHELGYRSQIQSREAGTHFIEALSGLRTVRSFTAEHYVIDHYARMTRAYKRTLFLIDLINSSAASLPTLLLSAGMLLATAKFLSASQLAIFLPGLIVGIMMVLRLLPLTTQTLDVVLRLTSDLKAAESVAEMLDAVEMAGKMDSAAWSGRDRGIRKIEFEKVSFRYSADTPLVLDRFSASFEAGKSYAISGPSGVGKSTIVDLLLKFYAPQAGQILVDGEDIRSMPDQLLRRRIVLAEQAVRIFHDTIERNVQFGRDVSSQDVAEALDQVGLSEFLDSLPEGRGTLLNYQGSNVSGGQRQRIGLARALLVSGEVLVMDESTSALDKVTRERILARILPLYRDRIVIFIAHDPAILAVVDEVIPLGAAAAPAAVG